MTTSQIKQAYNELPERQKASVSAWIHAERLSRDPAFAAELDRLNREMDDGKRWSFSQARALLNQRRLCGA